nr:putative ribonuclease h protein [Quercus suber]
MLNLRSRGLNSSGFCPLCDKEIESLHHALLLCSHAKHTWASWLDCPIKISTTGADIVDLTAQFIGEGKLSDLDLFFMVAWSIWGNRNQAIHNDAAIPPSQVWESARRALLDYKAARLNPLPSHPPARFHWAAPPPGFHKINVDGATGGGGGNSCIGVIIRDSSGATIGALCKVLPACLHAEVIEAYALHLGVLFALEIQITHLVNASSIT